MKITLTILFVFSLLNLQAQKQPPCPKYETALDSGNTFLHSNNYDQALKFFQVAQIAARECGKISDIPANKIKEVFDSLKAQKKFAFDQKKIAEQQTKEAKIEKRNAVNARKKTDSALFAVKKFRDAFNFYDNKFALVVGNVDALDGGSRFCFISPSGESIGKLEYWAKAEQFDYYTGLARVTSTIEQGGENYFLDTTGKTYLLADGIKGLNPNVTALDLSNQLLSEIPPVVFEQSQLEVLLLSHNLITTLPPEIGNLKKLLIIDVSENLLNSLPAEMSKLKNLNFLNLDKNPLATTEATRINKLLPYCKLIFNKSYDIRDWGHPEKFDWSKQGEQIQLYFLGFWKVTSADSSTFLLDSAGNRLMLSTNVEDLNPNITALDLRDQQLKVIPSDVFKRPQLEVLLLSGNQLTTLSSEITSLKKLQFLDISDNPILSTEIEKVRKLLPDCRVYPETTIPPPHPNLRRLK